MLKKEFIIKIDVVHKFKKYKAFKHSFTHFPIWLFIYIYICKNIT